MKDQAQPLRELAQRRNIDSAINYSSASDPKPLIKLQKTIAVTSGKGGVGKSNMALFLAAAFAAEKKRILLLDADLGLANVHILLGLAPRRTLADVVDGVCSIDDTITTVEGGFDLIPGASGIEKMANLCSDRLSVLRKDFLRLEQRYEMLLIDTAAGIGSTVVQLASSSDLAIVVMTPEPTSLADAYAMVKVLHERAAKRIGIIVNMTTSEREGMEVFDKLNALVLKFLRYRIERLGSVPYCRDVAQYVKKQRLLLLEKGDTPFARRIKNIAKRIGGETAADRKRGFFERVLNFSR